MADIKIPLLGENINSGTVVKVSVKPGDHITKGQTLLELETEKAVLEVPSPQEGVIKEVLIKTGQAVSPGAPAFTLENGGSASGNAPKESARREEAVRFSEVPQPPKEDQPLSNEERKQVRPTSDKEESEPGKAETEKEGLLPAAPSVRRLARELGVDLSRVAGSGPHGRISADDVQAHSQNLIAKGPQTSLPQSTGEPLPDFTKWGPAAREPMSAIRKKTALHMTHAWTSIPHVTHFTEVDVTDLEELRKKHSPDDLKLTLMPFLIQAAAVGLKKFPRLNSSVDISRQEIIFKQYCHIGIAVATEHGLLVPVLRDADKKSVLEIAHELRDLSDKARSRKLSLDEMAGGSFTITNLGGIAAGFFTPIVNWPEVAILGISRAEAKTVIINGQPVLRTMLPISLSYDHRVVDGADGAKFIQWIKDAIEQPFLLRM